MRLFECYEDSTLENAANGHSTPRGRKVLTSNVTIQKNLEQIFMITRLVNFLHFVIISYLLLIDADDFSRFSSFSHDFFVFS